MDALRPVLRLLFSSQPGGLVFDVSMLISRLYLAFFMAIGHGWGKLQNFSTLSESFPDPLGLGSPVSLALAVGAEVFASIAVALGLFTRLALIPLIITMLVAAFVIHGGDPLFMNRDGGSKEPALLFLFPYIILFLLGPGRFSVDDLLGRKVVR